MRDKQEDLLAPYRVDARLGGSVLEVLRAHPNHQAAGAGFFWFAAIGPEQVNRLVRLRGEIDTIHWVQIQDEPVAADLTAEQQRFESELDRLENLLGKPHREGTRLTPVRLARWNLADGQIVELRLETAAERQTARRTLTLGRPENTPPR